MQMAKSESRGLLYGSLAYLWVLYLIAFICGAALMSLEIVGGRLLSPFFGSSVYVWGSIISVFLIALSAGYYLGGVIADKKPSLFYLASFIAGAGLLVLIIPPLAPGLSRFFFSIGLANYGALVVAMLLFFLPSLGLGMVSPYVVKLGVRETDKLGNIVGTFYAVSTFGSILGTLATTFVLIPLFGVKEIIFTLGVILVILAAILLSGLRLWKHTLGVFLLMFLIFGTSVSALSVTAKSHNYDLVYSHESMYNDIFVNDLGDLRYMMFSEKLFQSGMLKTDPNSHLFNYTRLIEEAATHFSPEASDYLLIGLGGGSIPKALLTSKDNIYIDAVDIDPDVIRVAHEYFDMPKSPNLRTFATDGRMFLQFTDKHYDVVMIDAYNSLFIPFHLATTEFYNEVNGILKPGGLAIINIISSAEGEYSTFFKSLLNTVNQVFPEWRLFLAEGEDLESINNLILVASQSKLDSPRQLPGFLEYRKPIDFSGAQVLTDNYAPVETLGANLISKF